MYSVSSDELNGKREVHAGDTFLHDKCGKLHELQPAIKDGQPDDSLLWFKCDDQTFVGAINNRFLWD